MNIEAFLAKEYWFAYPPTLSKETTYLYLGVLGAMFFAGIIIKVLSSHSGLRGYLKKIILRIGNFLIVGAVFGGIFLFFRYEYLPILSYRFLFGIWAGCLAVWAVFIFSSWFQKRKFSRR